MTSLARADGRCNRRRALIISALMSLVVFYPLALEKVVETGIPEDSSNFATSMSDPWEDGDQPWPQPGGPLVECLLVLSMTQWVA